MTDPRIVTASDGLTFEDGPDRGRVVVFGRDTGGAYGLMEWTVAASQGSGPLSYGPHLHNGLEETFLIRSGQLEFLLDDQVTTLRAGDFVRVPRGVRHGYANTSGAPVEMLVGFIPGGFEELFVRYRTDVAGPPPGPGFIEDAVAQFGSVFEDAP